MTAIEVAQRYLNAWNARDSAAIVATFAEGGTYSDPASGGTISGPHLAGYTDALIAAFPDLSFDVVSAAETSPNQVAVQWVMKGTNSGPFAGGPPTGKSVALPGADFMEIEGDKLRSVQGYFDQKTFVEQLGLQAIVQPYQIGPVSFGTSVRMTTGKSDRPGAFSLTWVEVQSEEEANEVVALSQRVWQEMAGMPGFISGVNIRQGNRLITTTAWTDTDAPKELLKSGAHQEAIDRIFNSDFCASGMTSVWTLDHINSLFVRCPECHQPSDYDRVGGQCPCGKALPEPPPYW